MSGTKLFVIISAAVACGITIAIVAYSTLASATRHHSVIRPDGTVAPEDYAAVSPYGFSNEEEGFRRDLEDSKVDDVKAKLLGGTDWDWKRMATPFLETALQNIHFESEEHYIDDGKQLHDFYVQFADRMIKSGADVNTAFVKICRIEAYQYLLRNGASVNATLSKGYKGNTALLQCCDSGTKYADLYSDKVVFLLAHGATVNVTNDDGDTPLHLAAKSNSPKIITALLAAGATVNAKNNNGQTPFAIADAAMNTDAATVLKSAGGKS